MVISGAAPFAVVHKRGAPLRIGSLSRDKSFLWRKMDPVMSLMID